MFSWFSRRFGEDWLVRPEMAVFFFVCTIFVLILVPVFFGHISQGGSVGRQAFWGTAGAIGAPALLFLWIGMWRYWLKCAQTECFAPGCVSVLPLPKRAAQNLV